MSDRIDPQKDSQKMREYTLILLGVAALACVLGIILKPNLSWLLFALICGCAIMGIFVYRGAFSSQTPKLSRQRFANPNLRDALVYQSMTEAFQHPAYILDEDAYVRYSNQSASNIFGVIRKDEWLFLKFRQPELRRVIEEGLHSRKPMKTDYNDSVPHDRWFSVEVAPIPQLSGETINTNTRFLLSFQDLTEVKRTDQMRSDFIANASHELRTPLASLLGYLETIKGPARKDQKALDRFTDVMLDQARRMTRLVNDLLSLSSIEMKSHLRPSGNVNLTEIVTSVVISLEGMAKQIGVTIEFDQTDDIYVTGDRDELVQVFENIVENACKYGQEGKKVIVSLDVEDSARAPVATVSVKDFGPGISIEHQHRITERFYRVDVARSREKQGTGLGLAIVKHILNRHVTRLNVSSTPGEGTQFSVRFPVSQSEEK